MHETLAKRTTFIGNCNKTPAATNAHPLNIISHLSVSLSLSAVLILLYLLQSVAPVIKDDLFDDNLLLTTLVINAF